MRSVVDRNVVIRRMTVYESVQVSGCMQSARNCQTGVHDSNALQNYRCQTNRPCYTTDTLGSPILTNKYDPKFLLRCLLSRSDRLAAKLGSTPLCGQPVWCAGQDTLAVHVIQSSCRPRLSVCLVRLQCRGVSHFVTRMGWWSERLRERPQHHAGTCSLYLADVFGMSRARAHTHTHTHTPHTHTHTTHTPHHTHTLFRTRKLIT
jgi:hypothetical protein